MDIGTTNCTQPFQFISIITNKSLHKRVLSNVLLKRRAPSMADSSEV